MAATPSFDDEERYLRELAELVAIPSVSSEEAHRDDMTRAAAWVAAKLAFIGGRVVETSGAPLVLAEWLGAPGAPTILVYGHYDVQPAGDESAWETPPFEATVRDGSVFGRGTSDDKGPMLVALEVADAFWRADEALPLNLRFLVEGEEEVGSVSLQAFLEAHRNDLAADLVVSADGAMWRATEASIPIAAKGLLALDVTVEGPAADLHSGRHGGAVQNPLHALAATLASLHDEDGAVAVDGFYDDVASLGAADRAALAEVPFDEEAYRRDVGVEELHGEPEFTTLERLWTRPTIEINGISGGGSYTVIPRAAHAHVTCRLVPEQRPDRVAAAIEEHVRSHCPRGVQVTVVAREGAVPAYAIAADHPAVAAAQEALRRAYAGEEPLLVRMGGTLPAAAMFEQALGLKTLLFSFSTGDDNLHGPNERFRLDRLHAGLRAWSELWLLLREQASG
jgi:acetylornithine deacetylase/succinyl-diaminopimelate desuccinylase-like protein